MTQPQDDSVATKQCPMCAEAVKAQAVICRFCGYNFRTGRLPDRFAGGAGIDGPTGPSPSGDCPERPSLDSADIPRESQSAADPAERPSLAWTDTPPVPQQQQVHRVRYLSFGLSGTVAGFLWVTSVVFGVATALWIAYWAAWSDWALDDGGFAEFDRAVEAEDAAIGSVGFGVFVSFVTGILFIIWFFQAYKAGQSRGATRRTWGSGWTIGAWFIPLANLVIPKLVMNETDRMLNPEAGAAPTEDRWRDCKRLESSDVWWMLVILGVVISWVGSGMRAAVDVLESGYGTGILISAVGLGVNAAAAAVAGGMVLTIGRRGRSPG